MRRLSLAGSFWLSYDGSMQIRSWALGAALLCSSVPSLGVDAQGDPLVRALEDEARAGLESQQRFPEGRVRRGPLAIGATASMPLRLQRGSCYQLVVLTDGVGELDVVLRDHEGAELARARGTGRIAPPLVCADRPSRVVASIGPASGAGRYAAQLFAVNALQSTGVLVPEGPDGSARRGRKVHPGRADFATAL